MISEITHLNDLPHPSIDVRVDGPLGSIILKRDNKRNALTRSMIDAMLLALSDLHQEKRVSLVMITGAGSSFCAGTDLAEVAESAKEENAQMRWFTDVNAVRDLYEKMLRFPKPIVAAVNGPALGTGFGLVLASDIVVGCEDGRYGFPEPSRGLVAAHALPLLDFRLGGGRASFLTTTARVLNNTEASDVGVVHESVSAELLWAHCSQLADEIAKLPSEAMVISKRAISEGIGEKLSTLLTTGAAATATARTTEAAMEGMQAFVEKREPIWP